jgi:hypothetical protein
MLNQLACIEVQCISGYLASEEYFMIEGRKIKRRYNEYLKYALHFCFDMLQSGG